MLFVFALLHVCAIFMSYNVNNIKVRSPHNSIEGHIIRTNIKVAINKWISQLQFIVISCSSVSQHLHLYYKLHVQLLCASSLGGSTTTRLNMATTPPAEHRYTPPSSVRDISICSTFPSGVFGRGSPLSRDHVTMTSRDTLHTSTTVCPAVMVEGPSICTLGVVAVRGGRGGGREKKGGN